MEESQPKKYKTLIVGAGNVPKYAKLIRYAGIMDIVIAETMDGAMECGVDFGSITELHYKPPEIPPMELKKYRRDPDIIKSGREQRRERRKINRKNK